MKTLEEFKQEINSYIETMKPNNWRKGQAVFNYIDMKYGVARYLQYTLGIDCFYNDDVIDEFVNIAYKVLTEEL